MQFLVIYHQSKLTVIAKLMLIQDAAETLIGNVCYPNALDRLVSPLQSLVKIVPERLI